MWRRNGSANGSGARLCLTLLAAAGVGAFACSPPPEMARPSMVPHPTRETARSKGCPQAKDLPARQIKEVQLLGKLIAQETDDRDKQTLRQRLAIRYLDLADACRARIQALETCRPGGADGGGDATLAETKRQKTQYLTRAAAVYKDLLDSDPPPAAADENLYMLATILFELEKEKEGLALLRDLIKRYPQSAYVADAFLAFGEHYFVQGEVRRALQFYEQVRRFSGARVHGYATYKAAWCHINLDEPDAALALLAEVIRAGQAGPDRNLAQEALKDYVRTFARVGDPAQAVETLAALAPPADLEAALDQLEASWRNMGREDLAAALRAQRKSQPPNRAVQP